MDVESISIKRDRGNSKKWRPSLRVAIVVFKATQKVSEKEIRDLLPLDRLTEKGLELEKITVIEA